MLLLQEILKYFWLTDLRLEAGNGLARATAEHTSRTLANLTKYCKNLQNQYIAAGATRGASHFNIDLHTPNPVFYEIP